jgi:hypothetical protein
MWENVSLGEISYVQGDSNSMTVIKGEVGVIHWLKVMLLVL